MRTHRILFLFMGMVGLLSQVLDAATPSPPPTPPTGTPVPSSLVNISTRVDVQSDDEVLIGGFIIEGSGQKQVVLRALGPSLQLGNSTVLLADPTLELHMPDGSIVTNDNWRDNSPDDLAVLSTTQLNPSSDLESAIVADLPPGEYTAVLHGKANGTGVALIEGYDLQGLSSSQLANISTRAFVQNGDNVMIGGFIVGPSFGAAATVVVRALGPSLADRGISNPLLDPNLEVHDGDGNLIAENDNWMDGPNTAAIASVGLTPEAPTESALLEEVGPGAYTVIVTGADGGVGVALLEIYNVQLPF